MKGKNEIILNGATTQAALEFFLNGVAFKDRVVVRTWAFKDGMLTIGYEKVAEDKAA